MRRLSLLVVVALLVAACGDSTATTSTTAAPEATTATTQPPTTTQPSTTTEPPATTTVEVSPTVTFTGSDCTYSGPDTFSSGDFVEFTMRNESSVQVVVLVLALLGSTLEDLVADDVRVFPPTESWPPIGAEPEELYALRSLDPNIEVTHNVILHRGGDYGTACWPIDGNPALQGGLFTVEE